MARFIWDSDCIVSRYPTDKKDAWASSRIIRTTSGFVMRLEESQSEIEGKV